MEPMLAGTKAKGVAPIAVLVVAALTVAACGGGGSSSEEAGDCPEVPQELTPTGSGAAVYTMGIRINEAADVEQVESEIGDKIVARDVFLLNTEFSKANSTDSEDAIDDLT